ncbi:MAG: WD40 repeat domain-containing protein, partial [Myxococcota bacterium]
FVRVGGVQDAVTQGTTLGLLTAERWHWIPRADVDGRAVLEGSAVASPDRVSAFTSDGRSLVVRGRGRRALQRWDDGSPVAWPELADTDLRGGDVVALRGLARGVAVGARRGHSGWWQFEPRPVWHSAGLDGHVFRLSANDALLAFGSHQGELAIFDRAGTRLTHRNLPNRVSTLALADDRSRWFVGFAGAQGMAGCICDLDAEGTSDAACGEGCIRIATERLVDAHWSPDGSTLALVGYEGLDIRHQDRGWSEGRVRGAPGSDATARSPSGARFATADRDRVLRIRDFETGEVQLALTSFAPPQRLGFVDEHRLMVLDGETLRIWELSVDVLLAKACARWPAHIEPVVLGGVAALPDRTTLCSP